MMRRVRFCAICKFSLLVLFLPVLPSQVSQVYAQQLTSIEQRLPDGIWEANGEHRFRTTHYFQKKGKQVIGVLMAGWTPICYEGEFQGNNIITSKASQMNREGTDEVKSFKELAYNTRPSLAEYENLGIDYRFSPPFPFKPRRGKSGERDQKLLSACIAHYDQSTYEESATTSLSKSIVVFFGGALDHTYLNMKRLADDYEADMKLSGQTVEYFYHNASKTIPFTITPEVRDDFEQFLVSELKKTPDLAIILIGHSYGGDTAYKVATRLSKANIDVALLVTIDPVHPPTQRNKPANVQQWLNIYADMSIANQCNAVAKAGGQWKSQSAADFNQFAGGLDHCHAKDMFSLVRDRAQNVMTSTRVNAEERKRILESALFQQYVNGLGRTPAPGGRKRN